MANKLYSNFSGGMNAKAAPLIIKDTQCEIILNYNLDTTGALVKRNGYDVFATQPVTGKRVFGLFQYTNTSTPAETTQVMVVNNSGDTQSVIYYNNAGTWATSKTNDTAITSQAAASNFVRPRFSTFLNYLFRVNGLEVAGTSIDVNGSTWGTTNAPDTIFPCFIAVYQDRVYVANDNRASPNKAGSRLFFSALPSAGTISWTVGTDFVDVNPDDGDEITALENNGNRLLVFKNRSMYRWSFGQTDPDRIIGIGTQSQECVKTNFDLGITFFANEYGAYAYDPNKGRPRIISRAIQKWFDNVPATDVNDFAAEVDADHYYLYLSDSMTVDSRTYTNVMVVYTISLDAWTIYTLETPVRVMGKLIQSSSEDIYFGSNNGRTYQWNSGTADDSSGTNDDTASEISGEILSKEYLLSFPEKSTIDFIDVISYQHVGAKVSYDVDRKNDWKPLGVLSGRVSSFPFPMKTLAAHTLRIHITENSTNTSVVEGWNFESTSKPKR